MKGKIILQDITNPVEGMQVATHDKEIIIILGDNGNGWWKVKRNGIETNLSKSYQLKQIAVEYEEKNPGDTAPYYKTFILPLHPDDWKVAIALIGHEVEFKQTLYPHVEVEGGLWAIDPRKPIAELILPTLVRTIEDIPVENWDDIFKEVEENGFSDIAANVRYWLKQYYHAPKKKQS